MNILPPFTHTLKLYDFLTSVAHKIRYFEKYLLVGTKTGYQHSSKYHLLCSAEESHTGLKHYQGE